MPKHCIIQDLAIWYHFRSGKWSQSRENLKKHTNIYTYMYTYKHDLSSFSIHCMTPASRFRRSASVRKNSNHHAWSPVVISWEKAKAMSGYDSDGFVRFPCNIIEIVAVTTRAKCYASGKYTRTHYYLQTTGYLVRQTIIPWDMFEGDLQYYHYLLLQIGRSASVGI